MKTGDVMPLDGGISGLMVPIHEVSGNLIDGNWYYFNASGYMLTGVAANRWLLVLP